VRAFVAIHLSAEVHAQVEGLLAELREQLPFRGSRFVKPQQLHLTLQFLGNLAGEEVDRAMEAVERSCSRHEPFELRPGGLGTFPARGNPRVLWLGLEGDVERLRELQLTVAEELRGLGNAREEKDYSPHITLARLQSLGQSEVEAVRKVVTTNRTDQFKSWRVESVVLVESMLARGGANYSDILSAPLEAKP
jgi:RNA 2',3'-cyclic 3'-phosphodiesterase